MGKSDLPDRHCLPKLLLIKHFVLVCQTNTVCVQQQYLIEDLCGRSQAKLKPPASLLELLKCGN